jgi:hypothetical protein
MLMTDYDANTHHLRAKKEEKDRSDSSLELGEDRGRVGGPGTGGERFVQPLGR